MRIKFWGTRGSLPVSLTADQVRHKLIAAFTAAIGTTLDTREAIEEYVAALPFSVAGTFGGHSSCVQLTTDSPEFVLLDLGSGARPCGLNAMKESRGKGRYHIFLSHPHWDHIMGFPFFVPAYVPGNRITIYGGHDGLKEAFGTQQGAPFFPVDFAALGAEIDFVRLEPGRPYHIAGMSVSTMKQVHAGDSYGYRFEKDGAVFVYATDAEHKLDDSGHLQETVRFFRDADAVVFDAMYTLADALSIREEWGHSSNMVGVELCQMAGAKRLCLFHHDPVCDDDRLMDIQRDTRRLEELTRSGAELEVIAAYDGLELILESLSNQQKKENDMEIQARKEAQATVVTIAGRMDAVTAPEYEKKLNELMAAEENRFVVDFAQLDYISSAGLRALLATAKRLKTTNGQIRFANVNGTVKEIFDISGFGSIFQMDDSVAAALSTMA